MNIEEFRNYCLSFPECEEKMPFERFFHGKKSFIAFYVNGKMFCFFEIDNFDRCTIKYNSEEIREQIAVYESVIPPYNCNPKYWISIKFNDDMPDKEIKRLVRQSYEIVRKS